MQGPTETTAVNRSPFPKAEHIGENSRSVMLVDDDVDLHYVLFHAGDFDSGWRGSHNTRMATWQDDGDLKLKNGLSFGYRRYSTDPDHLRVNGREFDLRAGRVLVLNGDGSIAQLALFPSLAAARNVSEVARLVDAQDRAAIGQRPGLAVVPDSATRTVFGPVAVAVLTDDNPARTIR